MARWLNRRPAVRFLHTVYRQTLADPVSEGPLRDVDWPRGLQAIVWFGYAMFALAGVLVLLSSVIRQHSVLVPSGNTGVGVPSGAIWPMAVLLSFGVASFMSASLHGPWWLKIIGLLLFVSVVGPWSIRSPRLAGSLVWPVAAGVVVVGAVVFAILRWRRPFAGGSWR